MFMLIDCSVILYAASIRIAIKLEVLRVPGVETDVFPKPKRAFAKQ